LGIGDSVELKHSASNLSLVSVAISLITPLALYYNSLNHEVIRTSTGLEADSQENPVNTVGFLSTLSTLNAARFEIIFHASEFRLIFDSRGQVSAENAVVNSLTLYVSLLDEDR